MTLFSFRTLALAWTGLAGVAAVSAAALQASYVPPIPAPPAAAVAAAVAAPVATIATLPVARPAALPFENRSLLAMLPPPEIRPRPQPHLAEPRLAEALPVPPVPPLRTVRLEPRRAPVRTYVAEPAYAAAPAYPAWAWRGRLPYPGQYAMGRAYYGGQPGYYGWQPVY
jgi:hypothetical protein